MQKSTESNEVMTAREVAELLRVSSDTVHDYADAGKIPHRRMGRRLLFSRTAIMDWLRGSKP